MAAPDGGAPPPSRPRGPRKSKPGRYDGLTKRQVRAEIDSRTLESLLAAIHGLRSDIDGVIGKLTAGEREAPLLTRVSTLEADLRLLRGYLDAAGLRPPDRVQPPEFVAPAPVIVLERYAGGVSTDQSELASTPGPVASTRTVVVTGAKWGPRREGKGTLPMYAIVDGAPDDTEALFRIFARGEKEPFGVETGLVKDGRVEASWSYGNVGLALESLGSPLLYFTVDLLGVVTESDLLVGAAVMPWIERSEA